MRKLIIDEFMTLDGVVQAPGGAEEDTDGGFRHGGWHMQFTGDELAQQWVLKSIQESGGLVLGRRTYEIFAGYWPTASQEEQVIAEPLNSMPKYVVSRTRTEPLDWHNSVLLKGDLTAAVDELKRQEGADLHVIGSADLARQLIELGLADELRLTIDPIAVGGGKRLFPDDGFLKRMRLIESHMTSVGAILAAYAPTQD